MQRSRIVLVPYAQVKTSLLFALLFSVFSICHAAPPAGEETSRDQAKPAEAASREIKFVLEDEPWTVKLDENVPFRGPGGNARNTGSNASFYEQLGEQLSKRFPHAVIVRGFAPLLTFTDRSHERNLSPLAVQGLRFLADFNPSAASWRLREFADTNLRNLSFATPDFQRRFVFIVQQLPPWEFLFQTRLIADYDDRIRPPAGKHVVIVDGLQMAFTRGPRDFPWEINLDQIWPAPDAPRPPMQEFVFLAGSVEDAKALAKDFLDVYDLSFVPQVAKLARNAKSRLVASREEISPRLTKLEQQDAAAQRELEGVEELGQAAVSDLKVKRALLKVELAGVEARLAAIEAKLKKGDSTGLKGRLAELKVAADIDLASLAAQQKVLSTMIDGQHRLAELAQTREQELRPLQLQAERAARHIERCDEILADLIPFQLVDDSVMIRPVKIELPAAD